MVEKGKPEPKNAAAAALTAGQAIDPTESLASEAEMSAWRKYHSNRTAHPDLLSLVIDDRAGSKSAPKQAKSDDIVDELKARWKANLPYTSVGHQVLVVVNPQDRGNKQREREKELRKIMKSRAKESGSRPAEEPNGDDDFLLMLQDERDMLISDPRGNHAIQEHNQAHVFSLATRCYWHMMRDQQDQVIVVTGESASGKSETNKALMLQLMHLSNHYARKINHAMRGDTSLPPVDSRVPRRLMAALQLMEVMSHCRTSLNLNASRVHKYTEMQFNKHGKLVGAKIVDYMLEKRRVSKLFDYSKGESNFNIFYHLLVPGMFSREERDTFHLLDSSRSYKYLSFNEGKIDADAAPQPVLIRAVLKGCGFSVRSQDEVIRLLSCIMLLGNLEFAEDVSHRAEGAYVKSVETLEKCASLLGVTPEALETTLTQKTATVGATICADFLTLEQAKVTRDRFAVTLYGLIFDQMMALINQRLNADGPAEAKQAGTEAKRPKWAHWIGTFDFGGLENNPHKRTDGGGNRFWQFAANLADEKIQFWIRTHMFDFVDEVVGGIDADHIPSVQFTQQIEEGKNRLDGCITLLTHPMTGLIPIMDLETLRAVESPDGALPLTELFNRANVPVANRRFSVFKNTEDQGNKYFVSGHKTVFGVNHYGGTSLTHQGTHANIRINYDTADFLESNRMGGRGAGSNALSTDMVRLIKGTADFGTARNKFLSQLIDAQVNVERHSDPKSAITKVFRKSDTGLVRTPTTRRQNDDVKLTKIAAKAPEGDVSDASPSDSPTDSPVESQREIVTVTAASEFHGDLENLLQGLSQGDVRYWHVFCIKPNDELSSKKFNEERVKEQLKRFDLTPVVNKRVGEFTHAMSWREFYNRYALLDKPEAKKKGHGRHVSLASVELAPSEIDALKSKCQEIYQMYGIITGGGNGKIFAGKDKLLMNERSWWALERSLVAAEIRDRMENKHSRKSVDYADDDVSQVTDESENVETQEAAITQYREEIVNRRARRNIEDATKLSTQRKWWLYFVTFTTWWIPTFMIKYVGGMKRPEVIQAWREKVALNVIVLILSGIMLWLILGFSKALCPTQKIKTMTELAKGVNFGPTLVAIRGRIYDVTNYKDHPQALQMRILSGKDISWVFPKFPIAESENCKQMLSQASDPRLRRRAPVDPPPSSSGDSSGSSSPPSVAPVDLSDEESGSGVTGCRPPADMPSLGFGEDCHDTGLVMRKIKTKEVAVEYVSDVGHALSDIATHDSMEYDLWITIDGRVYDVTLASQNKYLPARTRTLIQNNAGGDLTEFKSEFQKNGVLSCFEEQYFVGQVDRRDTPQCLAADYALLSLTVVMCGVMMAKFTASLQLGSRRFPEEFNRHVILQVPCYTENEESLKKTINSLSLLDYEDDKKLLFIIADGLIKGSGNDRMTPEIVLDILGVENAHEKLMNDTEVPRFDYIALGEGSNRLNKAKVFSGHYKVDMHRVPYIVVVKCGKETEMRRPGNRGKRDSQLIMMKFMNRVFYDRPMCPLDLEMYRHVTATTGNDPNVYDYCLMVDADTEVLPDSLNRLVAVLIHDTHVMGLCGETQIGNENQSWTTMIQVFEYYMSHHLAKAFESLFGSVTCLPGCFCMYRLKTHGTKPEPLLIDDRIISDYEDNKVDTLHKKNLLSLGEDRYLTTLMLKTFPDFRNKFTPDAACKTIVPDQFAVLLSQRRRWINSTIHNLWELLLIPQLCGCLCFGMRAIVFLDLFATLVMPASLVYLVYLITDAVVNDSVYRIQSSLYLIAAMYGAQVVVFLLRKKWDMLMWMIIYWFSLPVFGFFLPLYAFWNFDDFSWGNTRQASGEKSGGHGAGDGEFFDETSVQFLKVADAKKITPGLETQVMKSSRTAAAEGKEGKSKKKGKSGKSKAEPSVAGEQASTVASSAMYYYPYYNPYAAYGYVPQTVRGPQPASPSLEAPKKGKKIEMIQGVPKALYPPPASLPIAVARLISGEIQAILQTEDLRTLTKKNVRQKVERNLRHEVSAVASGSELIKSFDAAKYQDLVDVGKNESFDFDLSEPADRRDWINNLVIYLLKD